MEQHSFHQPQMLRATSQVLTILLPVDLKSWSPQGISAPMLASEAQQKTKVTGPQAQEALSQVQAGPRQSLDSYRSRPKPTKSCRDQPDLVAGWARRHAPGSGLMGCHRGDRPSAVGSFLAKSNSKFLKDCPPLSPNSQGLIDIFGSFQ